MTADNTAGMPDWARHLVTHVHVVADDGTSHVFGPTDEVPQWARAKITNSQAWGEVPPSRPGPHLDFGGHDDDYGSDLPRLVDVICDKDHPPALVARFEVVPTAFYADDGRLAEHEWRWTASLAMHNRWDSTGGDDGRAQVDNNRKAVFTLEDGTRHVRLYCRLHPRPLDLPMRWEDAVRMFDTYRENRCVDISLSTLIATITT